MSLARSTNDDERQVRALYQRLLDSWGDAEAYAACFTEEADYVISDGALEHGRAEIVAGHDIIFSSWARDTRLAGTIHSLRFLTSEVAYVLAYGHIESGESPGDAEKEGTVYSIVAQKLGEEWLFVAYQNTPLTGIAWSEA